MARVEKQLNLSLRPIQNLWEEIDHKVRVAYGLVFDEDSEVGTQLQRKISAE